jgi:hypothetical protein
MSLHVISESKIRPTTAEIGDFEATGNDGAVLPRIFQGEMLACVVLGGREYWRQQEREEWMNRLIMRRHQFRTMVRSAIINQDSSGIRRG